MAEELGVAVLRVTADTREALAALEALRDAVNRGVGTNNGNFFRGLEQQARNAGSSIARALGEALNGTVGGFNFTGLETRAREAGARASRALREALSNANSTRLTFSGITEALNFGAALNGSVDDLREYQQALVRLRDGTNAATPGFTSLNGAIAEIGQTIRNFSASNEELVAGFQRLRQGASSTELGQLSQLYGQLETSSRRAAIAQAELARGERQVGEAADQATRRVQTFRQILSQIPGASLDSINGQIAALEEGMSSLSIRSQEFLTRLSGIAELELIRDRRLNRQRVNADFNAFASGRTGPDAFGGLPDLPPTVAGDLQLIDELTQRLRNVEEGSAAFELTQRELEQVQRRVQEALSGTSDAYRQLERDENGRIRRQEKLIQLQEYYADLNQRAGGVRDAGGAILARGANTVADERAYREVLSQGAAAFAERLRPALTTLALPSSDQLQQRVARDEQRQPRRLVPQSGPAIDVGLQAGRNFVDSLAGPSQTLQKLGSSAVQADSALTELPPIFGRLGRALAGLEGAVKRADEQYQDRMALVNKSLKDLADADRKRIARQQKIDDDRARRRSDAAGSALIGGAFPLLFGQGLGASIGGGLGGAGGGLLGGQFGFGLSLVGTAVGAQFDQASQKLQTLGSALNDPIGKFGELQQAGLLSSKGLESQIQALIDTGREAEAAALVQKDLATTYGDLQTAQELAKKADELNRSWSQLTVTLASFAVGPLAQTVADTSNGLQGFTAVIKQLGAVLANLPELPNILPAPLQLPRPVQDLVNQRLGGSLQSGILNILNPLKPVFDLGGGLGQIFGPQSPRQKGTDTKQANSAKIRQDVLQVQRQLVAAEAQSNKQASVRLKLSEIDKRLAQEKDKILAGQFAKDKQANTKAQQERIRAAEESAASERARIQEASKAGFSESQREFNRQNQLVGVYGAQRQILENQLKLAEEKRLVDQAQKDFNQGGQTKAEQDALNGAILRYRAQELQITEQIRQIEDQRWANAIAAANQLKAIQEQTAIELARPQLTGTGVGALQSVAALREAQRQEQNAQAQLRVQPGDEGLYNAAVQASEQVKLAAAKTRADLLDAYQSAQKSVRDISLSLSDAKTSLAELQNSSTQGLGQFLPSQANAQRQAQIGRDLQPLLDQARAQVPGLERISFTGPNQESVNNEIIKFINAVNAEQKARNTVLDTNDALLKANNDLAVVNASLRDTNAQLADATNGLVSSIGDLAAKDWGVYVNVDSQGGVSTYGDVLNGALS